MELYLGIQLLPRSWKSGANGALTRAALSGTFPSCRRQIPASRDAPSSSPIPPQVAAVPVATFFIW